MLLVELLRKKVDAILAAMGSSPLRAVHQQQTLWDAVDEIVRIAWTGYLVYSYVHGIRKPGLVILWALTLVKAAQRVAAVEVAKRSFAVGKNAHVVAGYTTQMLELEANGGSRDEQESGAVHLRKCWYAVMGEDRLKREVGPDGYRVELPTTPEEEKDLVTVGDIWELAGGGGDDKPADQLLADHPKLKDVCLAFALFKLLKARFENLKVHEDVVVTNRGLIFRGLGGGDGGAGSEEVDSSSDHRGTSAEKVFDVIELELNLAMDYYNHSVVPVATCSPWFLVGNHVLAFLVVLNQAVMVLFMAGNGRLLPVIGCLARDAVALSRRAIDLLRCLGRKLLKTVGLMLKSLNFLVCLMLVLTFVLLEASELVAYLLSDWFLVSMMCEYARRPRWRSSRCVRRAFAALLWVKRVGRRPRAGMRISQVCVLDLRRRHTPWVAISKYLRHRVLGVPSVPVPREVKRALFEALAAKTAGGEPLSNGAAVLRRRDRQGLLWACESRSVTRVILVWHIATSLFEMKNAAAAETGRSAEETVAATLSRYCAYLVACAPELLPENREGSERVYKSAKRDLRRALGGKRRGGESSESRLDRVMGIETGGPADDSDDAAANMGAQLGKQLLEGCGLDDDDGGGVARGWALLAELWTELVVYIAPSEGMEGHAKALARGGEFITLLWALATQVGITR